MLAFYESNACVFLILSAAATVVPYICACTSVCDGTGMGATLTSSVAVLVWCLLFLRSLDLDTNSLAGSIPPLLSALTGLQ